MRRTRPRPPSRHVRVMLEWARARCLSRRGQARRLCGDDEFCSPGVHGERSPDRRKIDREEAARAGLSTRRAAFFYAGVTARETRSAGTRTPQVVTSLD